MCTTTRRRAVIGLGNVGPQFKFTPHNIGFSALEALASEYAAVFQSGRMKNAMVAELTCKCGSDVVLVMPSTGMNDSGDALAELLNECDFDISEILVIFDDLSLPWGRMKIKTTNCDSASAGHNGVASLLQHVLEDRLLTALKLGVGPDPGGANRRSYVLSPIDLERLGLYQAVAREAAFCIEQWLEKDLIAVMNRYNAKSFVVQESDFA
ncbi:MAG: aminoacyl-tRNA hydrolase [Candidatus Melainabacteria bacterium]|nr:aminoacyl-tRNA hydrolase [Candidatus Melainabacteria bacterium]